MKRKCYALLALLLAVCMVLPMGVFVGADTPATGTGATETPKLTLKVSDYFDVGTGEEADFDGSNLSMAVDAAFTVNVSGLPDNTYSLDVVPGRKAIYACDVSGNNVTITARSEGTDDLKIVATSSDATKQKIEAVLTINILKKAIRGFKLVVTDKEGKEYELDSNATGHKIPRLTPGTVLTPKTVSVEYNSVEKGEVENVVATKTNISPEKIELSGGKYDYSVTFTDNKCAPVTENYTIIVEGKKLNKVVASAKTTDTYNDSDAPVPLKDNLVITAKYDDGDVTLDLNDPRVTYTVNYYNAAGVLDNSVEGITREISENYQFEVIYDTVTSEKYDVSKIIRFETAIPKTVTVTLHSNAKKEYVEGQTITDYTGMTVLVTYENSTKTKEFNTQSAIEDEVKAGRLSFGTFVYGGTSISVTYKEDRNTATGEINFAKNKITVSKKCVEDLTVSKKPTKLSYKAGDKLDLSGMVVTIIYNNGEKKSYAYNELPGLKFSPANDSILSKGEVTIYVMYEEVDPNSGKTITVTDDFPVTVGAASESITSASLTYGYTGKTEYFVGEKFKIDDFRVDFVYNNGKTKKAVKLTSGMIKKYEFDGNESTTLTSFQRAMTGVMKLTLSYDGNTAVLEIPITVTKRPNLKSISATFIKKDSKGYAIEGYYVGDKPSVTDFAINVQYDDGSIRQFIVTESDEKYDSKYPYTYKRDDDGVYYTIKLTPTTIEEDTKAVRISYNERVTLSGFTSNDTVYTDVEIKVTIPDCILKHYKSSWSREYESTAYESLYDALVAASDYDEIQLCRDVTMSTDYASRKTLEIDLNGHTLTMVRGELYVASNASSSTKITFTNSSRDDAHIRYTNNEDDDVIVAYNKEYVIDRNSKGDGRYDVTITSVKNGKVTGPTEVIHGHDAKFTITPDEGYEIAAIKVNSKTYKAASDNTLLIEDVREKLTVTVTFQEKAWQNPFTDVSKYATYYKAVQFVYEEGLFNGTSATKFEPDTTMTRAMFVTVLGRLAGVNVNNYKTSSFSDVATGQWYSEYVEWASSIGLVEGYGNGKFGPNDSITHAQMYVLMERYADIIEGKNTTASGTSISANDVRDIPDWAYEAVEYAAKKDFLVVSSYKLTPNDNAKRSELAMLLQKFCKNVLEY